MGRKDVSPSGQRVPGSCGPGIPSQGQQGAGLTCRPRADMDQAATSLPQPTLSSHPTQHGSGPSTVGASSGWVLPCSPIPRPHGIPSELVVSAQALTVHLGGLEARPPPRTPHLYPGKRAQSHVGQSSLRTVTGLRPAPGQMGGSARSEGHPKTPGQSLGHTKGTWWASSPQGQGQSEGAAHTRPASVQVSNVLFIRYFDDYK